MMMNVPVESGATKNDGDGDDDRDRLLENRDVVFLAESHVVVWYQVNHDALSMSMSMKQEESNSFLSDSLHCRHRHLHYRVVDALSSLSPLSPFQQHWMMPTMTVMTMNRRYDDASLLAFSSLLCATSLQLCRQLSALSAAPLASPCVATLIASCTLSHLTDYCCCCCCLMLPMQHAVVVAAVVVVFVARQDHLHHLTQQAVVQVR